MSHQSDLISQDILAYLKQHENKDLLRFLTCGNVDDGKSTLIGRLLYDSKLIYEDQLQAVTRDSKKVGTTGDAPDLALLVDGLQAEREQGITIDVAYRYFSTEKRKFIIADTPGHEQYTRNMATGASTADLAIILIDARYGVQTQTRRHSFIASLLGIRNIVVAVNKMDLVEFSEPRFNEIQAEYNEFVNQLGDRKPANIICTPQFLWNIFDYRVEVGGNATLLDYGTQFLYYFSPKYAGSSYVSGRIGYASTLGDCEIDDDYWNYCSVDGLTVGFSYGYAWKHLRVEAFVDMINSQVKHHDWRNGDESRQHLGTNFGFKAIYYGILSGNARSSLWNIL